MKKILTILILFLTIFSLTGCSYRKDALKFKKEYESLNGEKSSSGKTIRTIKIKKNNPVIYKTDEEIVDMINNKESFIVYFGFPSCPWCRSVLPTLLDVCNDLNIDKLYYVNVENIRDTMELNEDKKLITSKKGTDAYYELTNLLKDVLSDYTLKDGDIEFETGAKRIYAPNIIKIESGKAIGLEEGISGKQTDGYMKLTKEMKKETYNKFKKLLEK